MLIACRMEKKEKLRNTLNVIDLSKWKGVLPITNAGRQQELQI